MNLLELLKSEFFGVDGKRLDPRRLDTLRVMMEEALRVPAEQVQFCRLQSKKNVVFQIVFNRQSNNSEQSVVAKLFVTEGFKREMELLTLCNDRGIPAPRLLGGRDGVILMQYIHGENLIDRVNKTFDSQVIERLAEWYFHFHSITHLLKGDPRLHNFIVTQEKIVGLDFEEAQHGHWVIDIGGAGASMLSSTPVYDRRKRRLVWILFDNYLRYAGERRSSAIESRFIDAVADALEETAYWRRDDTIRELASHVRTRGIPL